MRSAQFDQKIPGDGLLIWHVDDAITAARGIAATNPSVQNTVNAGNPRLNTGESGVMVQNGAQVSTPSVPDGDTDGFNVAFGATAPAPPGS